MNKVTQTTLNSWKHYLVSSLTPFLCSFLYFFYTFLYNFLYFYTFFLLNLKIPYICFRIFSTLDLECMLHQASSNFICFGIFSFLLDLSEHVVCKYPLCCFILIELTFCSLYDCSMSRCSKTFHYKS